MNRILVLLKHESSLLFGFGPGTKTNKRETILNLCTTQDSIASLISG